MGCTVEPLLLEGEDEDPVETDFRCPWLSGFSVANGAVTVNGEDVNAGMVGGGSESDRDDTDTGRFGTVTKFAGD